MINVTNSAIVEKIKGTGRTFTLSLVVGSNTYTMVKSLKRSSIFASSQKLSVGETVSAFIEAEIQDCRQSLQNYEVQPKLTIDGYTFNLGYFKVQAPSQADGSGTQKITAYDRMSETSKYTYKATGLTSAKSTFSAICSICGYTAVTSGLTDVTINDRLLDGMDCRKALGYVAGVFGKNCVVGTDGKFKMVGYSTVSESICKISIDSLDTLEFPSQISTIDYFNALVTDETAYKSGTGNNGVNVVNPLFTSITQTSNILTNLKSSVGKNGYYPAKFKQLNGDPRIEVGDVIKVEHRDILTGEVTADYVPVMSLTLDYDGGVTVSIEAYPTEAEFSMSLSDKVDLTNSSNNAKIEDINNKVDGFEQDIDGANTKADFAVIQSQAVEELNKVIGNSLGLYQTKIEGAGGDTKYYFHNKSTLAESTYIISMTDQGFAFSNNWNNGNPVWTYGINPAGNSIMNYLVVNKISADLIEAGVIKSLDGAPINTEFSLNTGLFSLESISRKELFGFGANRDNHLLLQYNYSDGEKNNIKLGYYYNSRFYKDSAHTELIQPSTKYYYGDIPSGNFYQYSSSRYTVLTDLTELLKTYKGFILHSCGRTVGYDANDPLFGIVSDFNANMRSLLGGILGVVEDVEDYPESRTPILKFYDFENESVSGTDHYTAIRKQSIVTKHLGAENFCFYFNNSVTDLETLFNDVVTKISALNDETAVLKSEIKKLQDILGTKSLTVYVNANPTTGGIIQSGTGSYTLEDGSFTVSAYRISDYNISSVTLVYASDGSATTYSKAQLSANGWLNSAETRLDMTLPVESSRLGDTLNVTVNFSEPSKYTLSLNVDPAGSGTVKGAGSYLPNTEVSILANAKSGYEFVGWYENGSLKFSHNNPTITVGSDRTLTAKFNYVGSGGDDTTYYTIATSVSPSGAGSVSGGGSYPSGSSVSVAAEPENGYEFSHWNLYNPVYNQTVENVSTDNPWNITATANVTLTAVFTSTSGGGSSDGSVNINITKMGNGDVTVKRNGVDVTDTSDQYSFSVGDTVTLEAISYAGSNHQGWIDGDGNWLSYDSDYTFTVSSNTPTKITAWFSTI